MIFEALRHELRLLLRSRARLFALGLFLAAGCYAVFAATRSAATWQETVDSALTAEQDDVATVRGWIAEGQKGPPERPWADIGQPRWMDYYAGTRVARAPASLAGIAGGVGDDMPVAVNIRRTTDPFGASGVQIENPEFDRAKGLDLAFLLVTLAPLLIGVLAFGIGAREREAGLDRTLSIQTGRSSTWYLARSLAACGIATGAVALVGVLGIVILRPEPLPALSFLGILCLYTALWGGLHTLVAASSRRMRDAAVSYGLVWTLLCVLAPALVSEWALSEVAEDYAVDLSVEQRSATYENYKRDVAEELLPELYDAFPELTSLPVAQEETFPSSARRHIHDGLRLLALEQRHEARQQQEAAAQRDAARALWLSPAIAASLGFERLAGVDAAAASEFRDEVIENTRARVTWVLRTTWQAEPLTADDFDALVAASPGVLEPASSTTVPHLAALGVWALLAWCAGAWILRRADCRRV